MPAGVKSESRAAEPPALSSSSRFAVGLIFLASGAVALIYEGIWQRQFTLLFGSSAPATAAVLAAYFGGLGLGALVIGFFAGRLRNPLKVYAFLEAFIAASALLVTPLLELYADHYHHWFER